MEWDSSERQTTRAVSPTRRTNGKVIYRVYPDSVPFVTGLAPSYSTAYKAETLSEYVDKKTFKRAIRRINEALFQFWPCEICYYGFGLFLGILTCGLTWLLPYVCVRDAHQEMLTELDAVNLEIFNPKGLNLEYYGCCFRYVTTIKYSILGSPPLPNVLYTRINY